MSQEILHQALALNQAEIRSPPRRLVAFLLGHRSVLSQGCANKDACIRLGVQPRKFSSAKIRKMELWAISG